MGNQRAFGLGLEGRNRKRRGRHHDSHSAGEARRGCEIVRGCRFAMNEFELAARLTKLVPLNDSTIVGTGDDCAVIDVGLPEQWLLFKTDAVVEGIHFTADAPPEKIGHKALARSLSDVAAMAGTPSHALVTLGLPEDFDVAFVEKVYTGIGALAGRHQ